MPANLVLCRHLISRLAGGAAPEYLQNDPRHWLTRRPPFTFSPTQRREPWRAAPAHGCYPAAGRQWIEWDRDKIAPRHPPLSRADGARCGVQALFDLAL